MSIHVTHWVHNLWYLRHHMIVCTVQTLILDCVGSEWILQHLCPWVASFSFAAFLGILMTWTWPGLTSLCLPFHPEQNSGATPPPLSLRHEFPHKAHILSWILPGWQPSPWRNWMTAHSCCVDRFFTWNAGTCPCHNVTFCSNILLLLHSLLLTACVSCILPCDWSPVTGCIY